MQVQIGGNGDMTNNTAPPTTLASTAGGRVD